MKIVNFTKNKLYTTFLKEIFDNLIRRNTLNKKKFKYTITVSHQLFIRYLDCNFMSMKPIINVSTTSDVIKIFYLITLPLRT